MEKIVSPYVDEILEDARKAVIEKGLEGDINYFLGLPPRLPDSFLHSWVRSIIISR